MKSNLSIPIPHRSISLFLFKFPSCFPPLSVSHNISIENFIFTFKGRNVLAIYILRIIINIAFIIKLQNIETKNVYLLFFGKLFRFWNSLSWNDLDLIRFWPMYIKIVSPYHHSRYQMASPQIWFPNKLQST